MALKNFDDYLEEQEKEHPGYKQDVELLANIEMLGIKLKELRKNNGMSQNDLAEKLHVSQQRISEIENLKNGNITVKALLDYINNIGYKVDFTLEKVRNK